MTIPRQAERLKRRVDRLGPRRMAPLPGPVIGEPDRDKDETDDSCRLIATVRQGDATGDGEGDPSVQEDRVPRPIAARDNKKERGKYPLPNIG